MRRAISEPAVRRHLADASRGVAHTAALATFPEDLASALEDQYSDWLYLRYQVLVTAYNHYTIIETERLHCTAATFKKCLSLNNVAVFSGVLRTVHQQPSWEEVSRCHRHGKRVFLAGTTPALQGPPQSEVWRLAAEAQVDGFLTDTPFELPK